MRTAQRQAAASREGRRPFSRYRLGCPNCNQQQLVRVARQGFLHSYVLSFMGLYPWECAACGRKILIPKRSAG